MGSSHHLMSYQHPANPSPPPPPPPLGKTQPSHQDGSRFFYTPPTASQSPPPPPQPDGTYPEEVASLVLLQEQASGLRVLPPIRHVVGQAAAGSILHHQGQVFVREEGLLGLDNVHMAFPKVCLDLHSGKISDPNTLASRASTPGAVLMHSVLTQLFYILLIAVKQKAVRSVP